MLRDGKQAGAGTIDMLQSVQSLHKVNLCLIGALQQYLFSIPCMGVCVCVCVYIYIYICLQVASENEHVGRHVCGKQ